MGAGEAGIYHCNRCVGGGWLSGEETVGGTSYDHRKNWIQDRLEELAGIYAVDILSVATMFKCDFFCCPREDRAATCPVKL